MKILFITSRNVINTCGELRLIKNRALALHSEYGITTDFLVFRTNGCAKNKIEEVGGNSTVTPFLFSVKNPFTYFTKKRALKKEYISRLSGGEYDAVMLSGMMVFGLAGHIKRRFPDVKMIFDMHGAIEELIEFGTGGIKGVLKRILYKIVKRTEAKSIRYTDGIMAVSHALKKYCIAEYGVADKEFFIIPCAQSRAELNRDAMEKTRALYREKYGVKNDEILFIYSGGLSAWQCTDESVALFNEVKKCVPNAKMLFLTGNPSAVKERYESSDIMVDSAPVHLVNDVLTAGDYAFMLREQSFTNAVAYPNKFIEYVASGMKVVATEHVLDVADQIKKYDVGVILADDKAEELIRVVQNGYERLADIDGRNALLADVCFEERIKPLAEFLGK